VNILGFIVSIVLFVFGLYVMASAAYFVGFEGAVFIGGILLSSLGLFIPVHIMKRVDG
jgi:hypothetical protein